MEPNVKQKIIDYIFTHCKTKDTGLKAVEIAKRLKINPKTASGTLRILSEFIESEYQGVTKTYWAGDHKPTKQEILDSYCKTYVSAHERAWASGMSVLLKHLRHWVPARRWAPIPTGGTIIKRNG